MIQSPYNYTNNDARFRDVRYSARNVGTTKEVDTQETLENAICRIFGYNINDMKRDSRKRECIYPRQIMMYVMARHTDKTLDQIGNMCSFNKAKSYNHCDVLNVRNNVIPNRLDTLRGFKENMDKLESLIKSGTINMPQDV